jgi:hypothetical protein
MRAFDGPDLILDQPQAFALPLKLGAQQRRHLVAMGVPPLGPVPATDNDARTQVVQHQQRADTIRVRDAFACQPLQLSVLAPRIFIFSAGLVQNRPDPLAGAMSDEHCQQFVRIQPIGLSLPRSAVDFDARWIHDDVVDAEFAQPSMEPPAVPTCLVDAVHLGAPADLEPRGGLEDVGRDGGRVAGGDGIATHMKPVIAEADLPVFVAEIKADVQGAARGRILAP